MQLPVTIYKHWIGYVAIFLTGLLVMALVYWGLLQSIQSPWADPMIMFTFAVVIMGLVTVVVIERILVYSFASLTLTEDGITAINYSTLFAKKDSTTEWFRVQDVSVVTGSIFNLVFKFGTLNIQTAGTTQAIRMTMVPNVEYWQAIVSQLADQATDVQKVQLSTP